MTQDVTGLVERLRDIASKFAFMWTDETEAIDAAAAALTAQAERIAGLIQARDESVSLITAERERMDKLVESLQRDLAAAREARAKAVVRLVKLECACPYSDSETHGVQLMGPICDRCAAIHLLSGGSLPDDAARSK